MKIKMYTTKDNIDDLQETIKTALEIIAIYNDENSLELQKDCVDIDVDLINSNKITINDLIISIEKMRVSMKYLTEKWHSEMQSDEYVFKNVGDDEEIDDLDYELSDFDQDFYNDEKYSDYQAWTLDELYND